MNGEYVFCPRCGAVTKPGICSNCGYNMNRLDADDTENEYEGSNAETTYTETAPVNEYPSENKPKSSKGWIIGLILGIFVVGFLILVILAAAALMTFPLLNYVNAANNAHTQLQNVFNPTTPATPSPNTPQVPTTPGTNTDPDDETEYVDTISPLYSGTSRFDYEDFDSKYGSTANEFWDNPADDQNDYYINGSYTSYLGFSTDHNFTERDSFDKPYYEILCDSYEECDDYKVERRIIRYEGQVNGIFANAYCAYYQLTSDKYDFTQVNEKLRDQAISELYEYLENNDNQTENNLNYSLYCDCVITYNNDDVISFCYNVYSYENTYTENFYLHGINVDIKNAQIIDNTSLLNFDDDFSTFFKDRSNIQNSFVDAINYSPASDVTKVFNDDDSLILFFTPLGIEVGINYKYKYSHGWVTITINDFDQYIKTAPSFDTDWGHGYDIYQYEKDNNIIYDGDDYIYYETF